MRRRDLIYLIGCLAVTPAATFAQERIRRIAILMNRANDPEGQSRLATIKQTMEQLGWSEGRNLQMDSRWGEDEIASSANMPRNWSHSVLISSWPQAPSA